MITVALSNCDCSLSLAPSVVCVLWLNQNEDSSPKSVFVHTRTNLFSGVNGSSIIFPEGKRVTVFSISKVSFISTSYAL